MKDTPLPLYDGILEQPETDAHTRVSQDYDATGLSLKAHPVSFIRDTLDEHGATLARTLQSEELSPQGKRVKVAGLVLVRQRPGTASGIVFITLEDESGIANLIIRPQVFERYRSAARHSSVILVHGTVERAGAVVNVQVGKIEGVTMVDDGSASGHATSTDEDGGGGQVVPF